MWRGRRGVAEEGAEAGVGALCRERKGNMGELRAEYMAGKEGSGRGGEWLRLGKGRVCGREGGARLRWGTG